MAQTNNKSLFEEAESLLGLLSCMVLVPTNALKFLIDTQRQQLVEGANFVLEKAGIKLKEFEANKHNIGEARYNAMKVKISMANSLANLTLSLADGDGDIDAVRRVVIDYCRGCLL